MLALIALMLIPISWLSIEQLGEKHDNSPEYIVFGPSKLEIQLPNGEYEPHAGPYRAGEKLTYAIERYAARTVTAKTTRRIVQKLVSDKGISRKPIFTYPAPASGTRVDANPPNKAIISHVTIDLPPADLMPPGDGYVVESSLEYPPHGERDAMTYTSESVPFSVEK